MKRKSNAVDISDNIIDPTPKSEIMEIVNQLIVPPPPPSDIDNANADKEEESSTN